RRLPPTGGGRGAGPPTQEKRNPPVPFFARVLSVVRRIPPGRVATYGDVAAMAGQPRAARAVGNIMRDCRRADVPCHRGIAAGGGRGGDGGGPGRGGGEPGGRRVRGGGPGGRRDGGGPLQRVAQEPSSLLGWPPQSTARRFPSRLKKRR